MLKKIKKILTMLYLNLAIDNYIRQSIVKSYHSIITKTINFTMNQKPQISKNQ